MSSLVEQFQQAAASATGYVSDRPHFSDVTTTGIISAKLEDDTPMFSKQKINFDPGEDITHMTVRNNQLVLGMRNKIRRIDLVQHDESKDTDFRKLLNEKAKIYELFLDLNGKHLLISFIHSESQEPMENYYIGSKKPTIAAKMKGHIISAVAWDYRNTSEDTTGMILIGTTKGLIFETELACGEDRSFFQSSPEQSWKLVFDIDEKCKSSQIDSVPSLKNFTGLVYHKFSSSSYIILATTPSRIYQFIGSSTVTDPPVLLNIFNQLEIPSFIELPGELSYSKLQLHYSSPKELPKTCAWLTAPGILYGNMNYQTQFPDASIIEDQKLLKYPEDKCGQRIPLTMVVTEFHILLLFHDRIKVLSTFEGTLVYEDMFTELYGPLKGIIKDPVKGSIWVYSEMAIYRYKVVREDRHVWEVYLNKKMYDLARKYCKDDAIKLDKVLSKQAEDLFHAKQFEESARLYAQTHMPFEEVALRFMEAEQEDALKAFLKRKLEGLNRNNQTQITMTIFWLLEIFLNQLGILRNSGNKDTNQFRNLERDFRTFLQLEKVMKCLIDNRSAVYKLMTSHGDEDNLIYFTVLMEDYERVIQYHLQRKNPDAALDILTKQGKPHLFYQFSPVLMQLKPKRTIDVWIGQDRRLNPVRLIPALVQYDHPKDPEEPNDAVRYLEHSIYQMDCGDKAVHNYLLALYARFLPEKLLTYLEVQGQDPESIPYDPEFALRLCSELGLDKACVHIYATMGLYEEAVDLALKFDIDLAKQNADRPEDNEDLKKKLWLKIAKHVVKEEDDIKRAMMFLRECDLIKIEDILPFFPDFVTIDHFKDAICTSLQEYNQHIEGLKEEMTEATQSAEEIRMEIQTFRNRFNVVKAQQKCSACSYPILTRSFYLFPCRHMFHSDCLIDEVMDHLPPRKRNRVLEIQRQLSLLTGREDTTSISSASPLSSVLSSKDKLSFELDDLVASECIYCGDMMIKSIDEPFVPMEHYDEILRSWD